ncbi:MAG: hypothetical protein Q9183_005596, partial [Haloplaca sp. 2 TL-2023]
MHQSTLFTPFVLSVAISHPLLSARQAPRLCPGAGVGFQAPPPLAGETAPSPCGAFALGPTDAGELSDHLEKCGLAIEELCTGDMTLNTWHFVAKPGQQGTCEVGFWLPGRPAVPDAAPIPDSQFCRDTFDRMQQVTVRQRDAAVEGKIVGATTNLAVNPAQEGQELALPDGSLT